MNSLANRAVMETVSGRQIDLLNPSPADICIEDIAWHLSRINRYNGATIISDNNVSVAAHSLFVCAFIMEETGNHRLALHGLLHDAHEAYIGDIIRPVKLLPGMNDLIQVYSAPLQEAILLGLGVPDINPDEHSQVKFADNASMAYEAENFMHSRGKDWGIEDYIAGIQQWPHLGNVYKFTREKENELFVEWFNQLKQYSRH